MQIETTAGALGAEITGIDVANLSNEAATAVRDAFLAHKVVFFRDQSLTPVEQRRFASLFGEPEIYPFIKGFDEAPEVIEILKTETDQKNFGGSWHSDTSYMPEPALGTVLYALETPASGGDTMFASAAAAYDALSDGMKRMLDGVVAINSSEHGYAGGRAANMAKLDAMGETYNVAATVFESEHPLVRTHPETGLKSLYLNRSHTVRFKDMTEAESKPLIEYLTAHITRPEFTCRFRWQPGSIAVWDNRATQHFAINDYHGQRRRMHRVVLKGDRPL
ncbi:MAG: TauD/TfdA dioxygenase family protein [Alphaproteobacteria bacterium]|jgi:taurine dioxygenase